jgi:adenylosuccinate synthase
MTKATIICDLQYGSTGKGLISGYMAHEDPRFNVVVNANMPNAGHTYVDKDRNKFVFKVLPTAATSPHVKQILIGPGSIFSAIRLLEEVAILEEYRGDDPNWRVSIHPAAWPLDPKIHPEMEAQLMGLDIGSTRQGVLGALVDKLSRSGPSPLHALANAKLGHRINFVNRDQYRGILDWAERILVEGAQGFSLGVHEGFYPYCTSRDCTPAQIMADCGIPLDYHAITVGTARTYPIRVGGDSGQWYPDQWETSWDEIQRTAERTTVTNKIRRVATFSYEQINDAIWQCRPDYIFLNFLNYLTTMAEAEEMFQRIELIGQTHGDGVGIIRYMGFGDSHNDVEQRDLNSVLLQTQGGLR